MLSLGRESDRALVDRVLCGDAEAIEELLVTICGSMLTAIAREFSYDPEDLVQELYLHLAADDWRRLRTWKGDAAVKSWVRIVARNLCEDLVKDCRRCEPLSDEETLGPADDELRFIADERLDCIAIMDAIERINNSLYRSILYGLSEGKTLEQIALAYGETRDQLYVAKSRAVKQLREIMEAQA